MASLEKFLLASRSGATGLPEPPSGGEDESAAAKELDDAIWRREAERLYENPPFSDPKVVRVYVYEMPKRFTYDLLWLFRDTYKETSNLTSNGSPVHRLIEQVGLFSL